MQNKCETSKQSKRSSQQNCCNMDCCFGVYREMGCCEHDEFRKSNKHNPDKHRAESSPKSKEKIIYNNYKMAKRNGVKYISLFCPFGSYFVRVHGRYGHSFADGVTRIQIRLRSVFEHFRRFFFVFSPNIFRFVLMPRDYVWHRTLSTKEKCSRFACLGIQLRWDRIYVRGMYNLSRHDATVCAILVSVLTAYARN